MEVLGTINVVGIVYQSETCVMITPYMKLLTKNNNGNRKCICELNIET